MNSTRSRFGYLWFHFVMKLTSVLPDFVPTMRLRGALVRPCLASCGRNFQLCGNVVILSPDKMTVGDDVYLASGVWIQGHGGVTLDDQVMLGPYTVVASSNHTQEDGSYRFGGPSAAPVVFGRGSWTGAHVVVTAGVKIGAGAACAANAVVTKSVVANTVVGGVPAREI